ncbi:hypothetical protein [Kutzneria sp. NPDC052558]|uniref:hypothetical protein n=1 Tax=Kutzneria sp. NPDC052558 TaxID=3364121 RepID=UPI0037CBB610
MSQSLPDGLTLRAAQPTDLAQIGALLAERHPDVYPGPQVELMTALFPPVSADLLTYYVP